MSVLDEMLPSYIILYDPDTQFVREIEIHQVRHRCRLLFMMMMEMRQGDPLNGFNLLLPQFLSSLLGGTVSTCTLWCMKRVWKSSAT